MMCRFLITSDVQQEIGERCNSRTNKNAENNPIYVNLKAFQFNSLLDTVLPLLLMLTTHNKEAHAQGTIAEHTKHKASKTHSNAEALLYIVA